jgi:hypothetical protein
MERLPKLFQVVTSVEQLQRIVIIRQHWPSFRVRRRLKKRREMITPHPLRNNLRIFVKKPQ